MNEGVKMRLLSLLAITASLATAGDNLPLICTLASLSLYSTVTHKVAGVHSNHSYTIEQVLRHDNSRDYSKLLVNHKIYDLYEAKEYIKSYIRGGYIIYHSKGRYYFKKVNSKYTTRMICHPL